MKISTRTDVDVRIELVYAAVTDFDRWERRAMRRGADVVRTDPPEGPGLGSAWDSKFIFRGRRRALKAIVSQFEGPEHLSIDSKIGGIDASFHVQLMALSQRRTRMSVSTELVPTNLSSRLLVQSMKLAKASLSRRFTGAIDDFARELERENTVVTAGATIR
ncbi:MAG: SRPBCC family protein [Pseudomonadota bacterium]